MWKPMIPTLVDEPPLKKNWIFETKYDGFRCGLSWTSEDIKLISRNQKDLTENFPEVVEWCKSQQHKIEDLLPLFIDGEIVILRTEFQAIFDLVQQRGRIKTKKKINQAKQNRPATFMAFDLIHYQNHDISNQSLRDRRKKLEQISQHLQTENFAFRRPFNLVQQFNQYDEIHGVIKLHQAEGIVAKKTSSPYSNGKRTNDWVKIKNYRMVQGAITNWNANNDYFEVAYFNEDQFNTLGKVKNGFKEKDKKTLITFIQEHGEQTSSSLWSVHPSACIDIKCLDAKDGELREPFFHQFRFDLEPDDVTKDLVREGLAQLPKEIELSKPDKELFPHTTKRDYVLYLREVAPILLPRLQDKRLTMIRYPDGIDEHSFYQKHLPDYAPDYIQTVPGDEDEEDILCQDLKVYYGSVIMRHWSFTCISNHTLFLSR
ncbi:non-homologous end-joining DNA ligase [Piscibacillus salipiscarius]|uniref:non-homologous end-joining DNA ligase n=1 Tax=Piscibacillus salipiscarius TaxID=299480 RepID=UPI0024373014|nr:non-homologous end-joining DNA ligase [Piscibacillus salipiscarius]